MAVIEAMVETESRILEYFDALGKQMFLRQIFNFFDDVRDLSAAIEKETEIKCTYDEMIYGIIDELTDEFVTAFNIFDRIMGDVKDVEKLWDLENRKLFGYAHGTFYN